jgi:hypothetical protein
MYQAFQLTDYEALKRFIEKLAAKYEIQFDEDMAKPVLRQAVKQLSQTVGEVSRGATTKVPSIADAIDTIKEHIDKRLTAYMSSSSRTKGPATHTNRYSVSVDLGKIVNGATTQHVEIAEGMSIQEVFNHIYFMLEGEVEPYKYLEQWLLRDKETGTQLVIREVQSRIAASAIFIPGSKWEVVRLAKPYRPEGSPR